MKDKKTTLGLVLACGLSFLTTGRLLADPPSKTPPKTAVPKRVDLSSLLTLGVSGGSQVSTDPQVLSNTDTFLTNGLALVLRPQKARFSVAEPVMVELLLFNNRHEAVTFPEYWNLISEANCYVNIKYEQGQEVSLTAFGKDNYALPQPPPGLLSNVFHSVSQIVRIPPGRYVTYHLYLNRLFDMSRSGTYTVTVSKTVRDTAGAEGSHLISNTASIVIGEPGSPYDLLFETTSPQPPPPGQFYQKF